MKLEALLRHVSGEQARRRIGEDLEKVRLEGSRVSYFERAALTAPCPPYTPAIRLHDHPHLVFVDDAPRVGWGHPCRYRFYDGEGVFQKEERGQFPPFFERTFPANPPPPRTGSAAASWHTLLGVPALHGGRHPERRHAILFAGDQAFPSNVASLEFLWRTLTKTYGFAESRIKVLLGPGGRDLLRDERWPGDGTPYAMDVGGPGSGAALRAAIEEVGGQTKGGEGMLLLFTSNHGTVEGLCANENKIITPSMLGEWLGAYQGTDLVVTMQQCYAGYFRRAALDWRSNANRRVVFTSADDLAPAIAGQGLDPFSAAWIEALNGGRANGDPLDVDPDSDGDGRVSVRDLFDYAKRIDLADHPGYAELPEGCGADMFLGEYLLPELLAELMKRVDSLSERIGGDPKLVAPPGPERWPEDPAWKREQATRHALVALAESISSASSHFVAFRRPRHTT
jgi:hypothetical protein